MANKVDDPIIRRLESKKHDLLEQIRRAIEESGLQGYEVRSIDLFKRHVPLQCPVGQEPVWDLVRKPDGTLVYEWVCKPEGQG